MYFLLSILVTCPANGSFLDFNILSKLGDLCQSQSIVCFILLRSNIFLSTLFSNTCNLCSSFKVRECFIPIQNNWQNCFVDRIITVFKLKNNNKHFQTLFFF
jgi:hypothetical protein